MGSEFWHQFHHVLIRIGSFILRSGVRNGGGDNIEYVGGLAISYRSPPERGDERSSVYRKVGREAYQGGGEDGEEDAEAEDDAVARGLGEDRDAAEEAVSGKSAGTCSAATSFFFFGNRAAKGPRAPEMRTRDRMGDTTSIASVRVDRGVGAFG